MSIRSLRGNREVSPLTICQCRRWPAPGRRGAEAGDVRRGEVGLAHSSCEAGEQSVRIGAKGNEEQPHMRRTQSQESMSQRLSRVREAAEERTVYRIVPLSNSRGTGPIPSQNATKRRGLMPPVSAFKIPHWESNSPEIFALWR